MSMPVIDAWLDDDREHVWTKHACMGGQLVEAMLPHPQWQADEKGRVSPSVHCLACGAHQFVNVAHSRWWAESQEAEK